MCKKPLYKNNVICLLKVFVILLLQRLYPANCLAAVQLVVQLPYSVAQPPFTVGQVPSRVVQVPPRIFQLPSRAVCVPPPPQSEAGRAGKVFSRLALQALTLLCGWDTNNPGRHPNNPGQQMNNLGWQLSNSGRQLSNPGQQLNN